MSVNNWVSDLISKILATKTKKNKNSIIIVFNNIINIVINIDIINVVIVTVLSSLTREY